MSNLKSHLNADGSIANLLTGRFSRHPERYFDIFNVLRKYELHHVFARLILSHRHEEEDNDHLHEAHEKYDDHSQNHDSGLEELGHYFIKLCQLLITSLKLLNNVNNKAIASI